MKGTKAASRYAKALLELSIDLNKVDQVAGDMNFLLETSRETPEFQAFLNSPVVKVDKKISIFHEIFGQFEQESMKFVELVIKNRKESILPEIALSFEHQVKAHKGIIPIQLISAAPLNKATKEEILSKVQKTVNGELEVTEVLDAELIGGFIVRMGDMQIDASVSNQFNNLKQRLTR